MKRPILYIAIPFCLGIAVSKFLNIPITYPIIASFVFIAVAFLLDFEPGSRRQATRMNLVQRNVFSHVSLYLAVFFFGAAAYQNSVMLPADHISHYVKGGPQKVVLRGVVTDDPVTGQAMYGKKRTVFVLRAEAVEKIGGETVTGNKEWVGEKGIGGKMRGAEGLVRVSAYSDKGMPVSFGDELTLEGVLERPHSLKNPGVFDYESYLAINGIYAVLKVREGGLSTDAVERLDRNPTASVGWSGIKKAAYKLRRAIRGMIDKHLAPPYNGFTKAILIGDRSGLDDNLKDDFVKTGTVHILAISGLHVGLIAVLVMALFGIARVPKKANLALTLIFLVFYSFVAGSSPPIMRATIMFAIFAAAYIINREAEALNSLSIAAILVLLANPKELFDPGFQLSFASVASIILLAPRIDGIFRIDAISRKSFQGRALVYVCKGISVSIAAWLGTWPFIMHYFNIISPVSIVANIVIIPLSFVIMAASFIFIFAGFLSGSLGSLVARGLVAIERVMFYINHLFAGFKFAYFRPAAPSIGFLVLYYASILLLVLPSEMRIRTIRIKKPRLFIVVLVSLNLLIWNADAGFEKNELKITFLDVGGGDCAFIEFPGNGNMLIDGGPGGSDEGFDAGRGVVAPYLHARGIERIDAVVVTHLHADHVGGLIYVLNNFKIGCVLDNGSEIPDSGLYRKYKNTITGNRINYFAVGEGDVMVPASGVKLFVLNPPKDKNALSSGAEENDNSVVLKLAYKNFTCLFCADATEIAISRMISYGDFLESDILKVPHHGGRLGDEKVVSAFVDEVSPKVCVISRGKEGRILFGKSDKINYVIYSGAICYETCKDGAISVIVDKNSKWRASKYCKKN